MRAITCLLCAVGGLALTAPAASAVEMRTFGKAFCRGAPVRDYTAVLEKLPKAKPPPEHLPFGPPNLSLYQSTRSNVIVGRGGFGYGFFDETYGVRKKVNLQWDVTASLWQIDRKGRERRKVGSESQYLGIVRDFEKHSFWIDTPPGPSLYRFDLEFHDRRTGLRLGAYSEHLRVVKPRYLARIAVNRRTFAPGQTAFARVENPGTTWVFFGLPYGIQRRDSDRWRGQPVLPDNAAWPMVGLTMGSGGSGWCMAYKAPMVDAPTRFRFVKDLAPDDFHRRRGRIHFAHFEVRPGG